MGGLPDLGVGLGLAVTGMMGDRRHRLGHLVRTSTHSVSILALWQNFVAVAVLGVFLFV